MSVPTAQDIAMLDNSLAIAEQIIKKYPDATQFKILTNEFHSASEYSQNKKNALETVNKIPYAFIERNYGEVMQKLLQRVDALPKDIYLLSDFQQAFGNNEKKDTINRYFFIKSTPAGKSNIFVDSLFLENPYLFDNYSNKLVITFGYSGSEPQFNVPVKIIINETQVMATNIDVEPNAKKNIILTLNMPLSEYNKGKVTIEDYPMVFDNEFNFSLHKTEKIKIIEIRDDNSSDYINKVLGNRELFQFQQFHKNEVDYSQMEATDLLILNELRGSESVLFRNIETFLARGGNVVFIPSERTDTLSLKNTIFDLKKNNALMELIELSKPDFSIPFFRDIVETASAEITSFPQVYPFFVFLQKGKTLLACKSGDSFLTQVNDNLYLFTTPFQEKYNQLMNHALFVPVFYKIAFRSKKTNQNLSYRIEENQCSYYKDSLVLDKHYKFKNNDNIIIPNQRIDGNKIYFDIPKLLIKPGNYDLLEDTKIVGSFSFNISKTESLFVETTEETLVSAFQNIKYKQFFYEDSPERFSEDLDTARQGTELWQYCIIIALLCIFLEIMSLKYLL